jgi:uracil-DNA glycosylase family 4
MAKLTDLSLDELYARPKITSASQAAIIKLTDFSRIDSRYCETICKLKCKSTNTVFLLNNEVDVLIVQDHESPPGKYDRRSDQQEKIQLGIINFISKQAGLSGLTYRVTSLLKCKATNQDFPSGKPPTQTTLQKCSPYLIGEIQRTKPKVIISLGTAVTKSLGLSTKSNSGNRGEVCMSEYGPVVLTLHPRILSYIRQNARGQGGMWGPDYMKVIQRDFEKASKIARGHWKFDENTHANALVALNDRIKIARSIADVKSIVDTINSLPENVVISFDTETTSLDPLDPKLRILTIQFGWRDPVSGKIVAGVIPLRHRKNNFYNHDEAWSLVQPVLLSKRAKVGHNAKFDILVLYWAEGVRVQNVVFDTLLLLHSIESGTQGCYGLKVACWDYLYEEGYAGYEDGLGDLKKLAKLRAKEAEAEAGTEYPD